MMRRGLQLLLLVGLVGAGLAGPAVADSASSCGPLSGTFGVLVAGEDIATQTLKYLTGTLTFSGCSVSGTVFAGSEGSISADWVSASGSVTQTANGTLLIALSVPGMSAPQAYSVGYSSRANEALGIEIDGLLTGDPLGSLVTASIDMQAQVFQPRLTNATAAPPLSYTDSTLSGAWVASCSSPQGSTDVNYINFDGEGNILPTSADNFNNYGSYGVAGYSGTYTVSSDGRISGLANVDGNVFNFAGVISRDQTEIQYFYFNGSGAVTGCTGKKV